MGFILDMYRTFIKEKAPVKMENIKPNSPAAKLLATQPKFVFLQTLTC